MNRYMWQPYFYDCNLLLILLLILPLTLFEHWSQIETMILENDLFCMDILMVCVMAILGLVRCYSSNLGPRVALSTHAIYLPCLILPKYIILPNEEQAKLISLFSKYDSMKMLTSHLSPLSRIQN